MLHYVLSSSLDESVTFKGGAWNDGKVLLCLILYFANTTFYPGDNAALSLRRMHTGPAEHQTFRRQRVEQLLSRQTKRSRQRPVRIHVQVLSHPGENIL